MMKSYFWKIFLNFIELKSNKIKSRDQTFALKNIHSMNKLFNNHWTKGSKL